MKEDSTEPVGYGEGGTKELKESRNIRIFECGPEAEEAGSSDTCPLVRLH